MTAATTSVAARAHEIRRLVVEMALAAGSCHIGSALSIADILAVLYGGVLRDLHGRPDGSSGDRFVLSKGHAASALYAALATVDILDPHDVVAGYSQDGGAYAGHPERTTPGVTTSSGSLGHGPALALGLALADRADGTGRRTFCLVGDGELNEGSVWEAIALAGHLALPGLVLVVDANGWQGLGAVADVNDLEPLDAKLAAFRWDVATVDGHDLDALGTTLAAAAPRPRAVIARTVKGSGLDFMEDTFMSHYRSLRPADRERALASLERRRAA